MSSTRGRGTLLRNVVCLTVVGCGGSLRTVPEGPHAATSTLAVVVTSPPPPARIEHVPADPGGNCAWLDGQWVWAGQHWEWQAGDWVVAPPHCHYAEPGLTWVETVGQGALYHLPGAWYPDTEGQPCAPVRSCLAPTGRSE